MKSALTYQEQQDLMYKDYVSNIIEAGFLHDIIDEKYNIEAISIKRTNDYNSLNLTGNISSASSIRTCLKDNISICDYVPKNVINSIYNTQKYYYYVTYFFINVYSLTCFLFCF